MGVGGNQVRDLEARWQTDVLGLASDWASVLIGINDVCVSSILPCKRRSTYRPRNTSAAMSA